MQGTPLSIEGVHISSPKRSRSAYRDWQGFFPYYAGFPLAFAQQAIASLALPETARIFDPWNGSGTTSFAASEAGYRSIGFDLNPVMVVVARARTLPLAEADALQPIASQIIENTKLLCVTIEAEDPLLEWFKPEAANVIRKVERSMRQLLVGGLTRSQSGVDLSMLSSIAATFYVALFSSVRTLLRELTTTNPTWMKVPKTPGDCLAPEPHAVYAGFTSAVREMAAALVDRRRLVTSHKAGPGSADIRLSDSSTISLESNSVDLILTSPPYCTRLDYARLTRIEMAILSGLVPCSYKNVKRELLGSVIAPREIKDPDKDWGTICLDFLGQIRSHKSKASGSYYFRNHVDYFDKLFRSIKHAANALRPGGAGVFVIQDSYYKEVHNPLQHIAGDMFAKNGLALIKQYDFSVPHTMAARHRHAEIYRSDTQAIESVLCVTKN